MLEVDGQFWSFSGCHRYEVGGKYANKGAHVHGMAAAHEGSFLTLCCTLLSFLTLLPSPPSLLTAGQAHQRLGKETILCRVRKAPRSMLRFHM